LISEKKQQKIRILEHWVVVVVAVLMVISKTLLSSRFLADDNTELEFYAREPFVSRQGFTFLVAGRITTIRGKYRATNLLLSLYSYPATVWREISYRLT